MPTIFSYEKKSKEINLQSTLPFVDGEMRDAKWINCAGGKKMFLIARNNDQLIFLRPTQEK